MDVYHHGRFIEEGALCHVCDGHAEITRQDDNVDACPRCRDLAEIEYYSLRGRELCKTPLK